LGRPKIGVTVRRRQSESFRDYLRRIEEAGGDPIALAPAETIVPEVLASIDGLLLPGGGDVAPSRYGEAPHAETAGIRPELDEMESALIVTARAAGLPILAICRGQQILNVTLGGALHQHIEGDGHRAGAGEGNPSRWHQVHVETGSRLATLIGDGPHTVNSRHHQAVRPDSIAPDLRAVALSPDGFVEAAESRDGAWIVSVQWHPERDEMIDASRPLFEGLIQAAATYSRAGNRTLR
jgi:putative glutamine amidotransferase